MYNYVINLTKSKVDVINLTKKEIHNTKLDSNECSYEHKVLDGHKSSAVVWENNVIEHKRIEIGDRGQFYLAVFLSLLLLLTMAFIVCAGQIRVPAYNISYSILDKDTILSIDSLIASTDGMQIDAIITDIDTVRIQF